jgi:chromosome segregation ATPase
MIYLLAQSWGFLLIAWLIGMIVGGLLMLSRRSTRVTELESDLRDARNRGISFEKEALELRARVGEFEGVPEAERKARINTRQELIDRIAKLDGDVVMAKASERHALEAADALRREVRDINAKLADEKTRVAAAASLTPAQAASDDERKLKLAELETKLGDATRQAELRAGEVKMLKTQLADVEQRVSRGLEGAKDQDSLRKRIGEFEAQSRADASAAADRAAALLNRISELEGELKEKDIALATSPKALAPPQELLNELTSARRDAEQLVPLRARAAELERRLATAEHALLDAQSHKERASLLESDLEAAKRASMDARNLQARVQQLETEMGAERTRHAAEIKRVAEENFRLQDDLKRAVGETADRARVSDEAERSRAEATLAKSRLRELEGAVEDERRRAEGAARGEVMRLQAQLNDMEAKHAAASAQSADAVALKAQLSEAQARAQSLQRSADEANALRARVSDMEAMIAAAQGAAHAHAAEAEHLKGRVAEHEGRAHAAHAAAGDLSAMRTRISELEASLTDAARARDEAAILRAKVSEMDGRLGQALKKGAEADALRAKLAALEGRVV